jgi:hypothetical protein
VGKFNTIKKSRKTSSSLIDEKIESLNKELVKTGMISEISNSTSGLYSVVDEIPAVPAVPPTLSNVPDTSGITGSGFVQNDNTEDNTGYNDITQLFNNNINNGTPIVQTPAETPAGGVGLVWHTYTLNGEAVGYIGAGNKFVQVLNPSIAGGTDLSYAGEGYRGGNYYTKMALRKSFAEAYIGADHRAYVTIIGSYITWRCWLPYNPYGFGALYADYTGIKKTDAQGSWGLANVILGIRPNKYTSDPGAPYIPRRTNLISRNSSSDGSYYTGLNVVGRIGNKWGLSNEAYNSLVASSLSGPRNMDTAPTMNPAPKGPYTPIKNYGGNMGYGPSGPSSDPWGGKGPLGPIPGV